MKTLHVTFISVMCAALYAIVPAFAADTMTLAYNGSPDELAGWKLVHLVTEEMFRRLDIPMTYNVMPARRASEEANEGRMDGDNARIYAYNENFPNLMRVNESIYTQVLAAYVTNPEIHLDSWENFRNTSYKVEYMRGVVYVEKKLSEVVAPERLSYITTRIQGIKKLAVRRTDVFVDVDALIVSLLKLDEFKNSGIQKAGVLESMPLYLFMHKKHADLIPKLEKVLVQIKTEGLYDRYAQQVFSADTGN